MAGKGLEFVQGLGRLKGFGIQLQRCWRTIATGTSSCMFFQVCGMGRTVSPKKITGQTASGSLHQRLTVHFTLKHRQTVIVRANAPHKQGVAVVQKMLRSDGGGRMSSGLCHILRSFACGDVFQHDFQFWHLLPQRLQHTLDEDGLPIENVHIRTCDFAMNQQRHAIQLHRLQYLAAPAQIGDSCVAVGGSSCRIQLESNNACVVRLADFVRIGIVREIKRHHRNKCITPRDSLDDALAIRERLLRCDDRRLQVRHDNGAGKLRGSMGNRGLQMHAIAQMHMPVIGACEGNRMEHG